MNREHVKVPLKSDRLRYWLAEQGMSIMELSRRVKVSEKTIRRSLVAEEIIHDLGYMISYALDIDPYEILDLTGYIDRIVSRVGKRDRA